MRIVNRKAFLALPEGIVFAKYAPCYMERMLIKGDSLLDDFYYQPIVDSIACNSSDEFVMLVDASVRDGSSIPMGFDVQSRDGCYDEDQLFAIFEDADIDKLILRLQQAKKDCSKPIEKISAG